MRRLRLRIDRPKPSKADENILTPTEIAALLASHKTWLLHIQTPAAHGLGFTESQDEHLKKGLGYSTRNSARKKV